MSPSNRPDAIADQAIEWMVLLRSGAMSARQRGDMAAWLARDARHRQAWERLQGMLAGAAEIRRVGARCPGAADDARDLLLQPRRRAVLRGALVAALAAGGGLWLGDRATPLQTLAADLCTATGQRRTFDLPDGSRVTLNARSAADVAFGPRRRLLRLRQGELLARVAADAPRPFEVESAQGTVRALGTRFCVRQEGDATVVAVLRHGVAIATRGGSRATLGQGRTARFGPGGIESMRRHAEREADWSNGRLSVIDVPLAEAVERLRPYRRGWLRLSPEVAGLRVQGVFPLDDTELALRALEETLPVRLRRYGPVTVIDAA